MELFKEGTRAVTESGADHPPFEEPADLSLDGAAIERVARTDHPVAETLESFFDSFGEALMDRFLFLNPFVRAAQHERLRSVRTEADTHLHSFARLLPSVGGEQFLLPLGQLRTRGSQQIAPSCLLQPGHV